MTAAPSASRISSKNKEAALLFLQYVGQPRFSRLGGRSAAHHQHLDL